MMENLLKEASSDLRRIKREARLWKADPTGYVESRYDAICNYDFPVYAASALKISGKTAGKAFPLLLNRPQRRVWTMTLEDIIAGKPVRHLIVKSRQEGMSTFYLGLFYWLSSLRANRNSLIVSHDDPSTQNFNRRVQAIHADCEPSLRPPIHSMNRDVIHFGTSSAERRKGLGNGLDSRIAFMGAGTGEIARSYNFQNVLLSEFAMWEGMGIDVESQMQSLNQAVPDLAGTIIAIETTAKGSGMTSVMWNDKANGYRKIFLPWVADERYRLPSGVPLTNLEGADDRGGRPTRYGNEVEEAKLIIAALKEWYPADLHKGGDKWAQDEVNARLNWRRDMIDKKCLGDVGRFRQEYPTRVEHAFASKATYIFDYGSIETMVEFANVEALPVTHYSYIHDNEETDPNTKFKQTPYGDVMIWKHPTPQAQYVIGADPGMGIANSGDPSALVVLAVPDLEEVASYNQIVTPDRFAGLLNYIGMIYNTALIAVEDNERGGYAANLELASRYYYSRLYRRRDLYDKKEATKPGFNSTDKTKSAIVTLTQQAIRDREILFRTPALLEQLQAYMLQANGKMGGVGMHDDLVSAAMLAVFLSTKVHMYEPATKRAPKGSFDWHVQKQLERDSARGRRWR